MRSCWPSCCRWSGCTSPTDEDSVSTPSPAAPTPSVTQAAVDDVDIVITRPDWPSLETDAVAPPRRDAVPLSENPVRRAALAVTDLAGDRGIYVLGRDGEWRRSTVRTCGTSSRGPAGVARALAQRPRRQRHPAGCSSGREPGRDRPDDRGLRALRVPGQNDHVAWEDPSHVLVGQDRRLSGRLVDLETGQLTESTHRDTTRVPCRRPRSDVGWRPGQRQLLLQRVEVGRRLPNDLAGNNSLAATSPREGTSSGAQAALTPAQPGAADLHDELDVLMREVDGVSAVDSVDRRCPRVPRPERRRDRGDVSSWAGSATSGLGPGRCLR